MTTKESAHGHGPFLQRIVSIAVAHIRATLKLVNRSVREYIYRTTFKVK
jgi:hypothetical protein